MKLGDYLMIDLTSPTGLRWKKAPPRKPALLGEPAFTSVTKKGYYRGKFGGVNYQAHRVVFFLKHGYWPETVDHLDRDKQNNDPDNLADKSNLENQWNRDHRGTYQRPSGNWTAEIERNGVRQRLGTYPAEEAAHAAYLKARDEPVPL